MRRSGTFRLSACTVVQRRGHPLEGVFSLGLLSRGCTPEGLQSEELVCEGYSRQPVQFGPPAEFGQVIRSAGRVSFGAIDQIGSDARLAAIYDDDNVVAYGLISIVPGMIAATEVAFEPGAISVRF